MALLFIDTFGTYSSLPAHLREADGPCCLFDPPYPAPGAWLLQVGPHRLRVMAEVRAHLGVTPAQARAVLERLPVCLGVVDAWTPAPDHVLAARLRHLGAEVAVQEHPEPEPINWGNLHPGQTLPQP
jgi:hypothetical protein